MGVVAIGVAGATSLVAPLAFRPILERFKTFDVPVERSSHSHPTLRGGGLGPLLGLVVGSLVALWLGVPWIPISAFVAAALVTGVVGFVEDVRGLPVSVRLGSQLIVGMLLAIAAVVALGTAWWIVPIGALAFAGYVNVANFMDGVDGISAFHGLVVGLTYAVIGLVVSLDWLVVMGGLIAAAFIAFLPWNLVGAKMFLGDVGSYTLGASIAATALLSVASGVNPIAVVAPLLVYIADVGVTVCKRALRRESLAQAHREHNYQVLAAQGWQHTRVALLVAGASLLSGFAGLLALTGSVIAGGVAIVACLVIVVGYFVCVRLFKDKGVIAV